MANNYTPSYNQYLTHTAGYALPSSVKTYSVFDPSSNSWRRMTNDGRSPIPAQGQAVVPVQAPAQTPIGGSRMAPKPQLGGGMGVPASQPSASPRRASMSPAEAVAFGVALQNPGVNLQAQPRVFMPLESRYEKFQREIPKSNAYSPLQNPRVVRNMSPDYQDPTAASPITLITTGKQMPVVDFPEYVDSPITRDLLRLGRGFKRLFSRPSMAEEATAALRASTGLPPLE